MEKIENNFRNIWWFIFLDFLVLILLKCNNISTKYIFYFLFLISIILWGVLNNYKSNFNFKRLVGTFPDKFNWLKLICLSLIFFIFSLGLFFIITKLNFFKNIINNIINNSKNVYPFFVFFKIVLLAPVIEEILFRGILLHYFVFKYNITKGIIIISLIFAVLHINFIPSIVFSLVVSILYIKSKTLYVPIIFHSLYNILCKLIPDNLFLQNNEIIDIPMLPVFILVIISSIIIILYLIKNWPDRKETKLPYLYNKYL